MKRISTLIALAALAVGLGVSDTAAAAGKTPEAAYRPGIVDIDRGYRPGRATVLMPRIRL